VCIPVGSWHLGHVHQKFLLTFRWSLLSNEGKSLLNQIKGFSTEPLSCLEAFKARKWLWIRIWIGSGFSDFVDPDPDPYWEYGSRYFWFDMNQILISKKFEKEIVFESSVLAWIRIRIRIKSIWIHNPAWRPYGTRTTVALKFIMVTKCLNLTRFD
jgi:hypothetical protein